MAQREAAETPGSASAAGQFKYRVGNSNVFLLSFTAVGSSHYSYYTVALMSLILNSPIFSGFHPLTHLDCYPLNLTPQSLILFFLNYLSISFLYIYSSSTLTSLAFSSVWTLSFLYPILPYTAIISLRSYLLFLSFLLFLLFCCVTQRSKRSTIRRDFSVLQLWQQLCVSSVTAIYTRTITQMHQNLTSPPTNQIEAQRSISAEMKGLRDLTKTWFVC